MFYRFVYNCFTSLLVAAVLLRLLYTYFPELDYKWETYYITTQLSDLNNITIWLLLPAVISVSIKNMWEQQPHIHISMFTIVLGVGVLSYDFWIIYTIFTTWTVNFAWIIQPLYLLPSLALIAHSMYQIFYLTSKEGIMAVGNHLQTPITNAIFNGVMILHLLTIVAIFQPNCIILIYIELMYRVWAIYKFVFKHPTLKLPVPQSTTNLVMMSLVTYRHPFGDFITIFDCVKTS